MEDKLNEIKTGLSQYAYRYYKELVALTNQEEAKRLTREVVSSLLEPFSGGPLGEVSYFSLLSDWEKDWLEEELTGIRQKDYDKQENAMVALQAIRALKPLAQERDEMNGFK